MDRSAQLAEIRLRLLDRFLTLSSLYTLNITFDQLWYNFLVKHFVSDSSTEKVYQEVCNELEESVGIHR